MIRCKQCQYFDEESDSCLYSEEKGAFINKYKSACDAFEWKEDD